MENLRKFTLHTAGLLFCAVLLSLQPAWAVSEAKVCPPEPTQNVPIKSGDVFAGTDCIISPITDLDSFRFGGSANHIYRIGLSLNGEGYPKNICMELYDPEFVRLVTACSNTGNAARSVVIDQKLEKSGFHSIQVSAAGNNTTAAYAISLERFYPMPADAREMKPAEPVTDEINPLADSDLFSFYAAAPGKYRITASIAGGGYPQDLCFSVLGPDGLGLEGGCTRTGNGVTSVSLDFTPSRNGMHLILVSEAGYDSTIGYTLNVQCLTRCPGTPCTLKNTPTYNSGTLTMRFTLGVGEQLQDPVWNTWLVQQNDAKLLWSTDEGVIDPPREITRTRGVPPSGRVGILSTLTTPAGGIRCQSWTIVDTGRPAGSGSDEELDMHIENEP